MSDELSKFFITFKTYVVTDDRKKRLDKNLILRFKAFTEDAQRELCRQYIASVDAIEFLRAVENKEPIIFKVETFRIDTKRRVLTFKLPCRESVRIHLDGNLINEITAHDLMLSYIRGIPKLVKNRRYTYYVLEDVEIRTYRPKTDIAKDLLNEYEPLDLIAYALGYKPTPEVKALILPRILPLFMTNEDSSGTHVLSLTSPGLGKSECAKILSELAQAYFSPFFPATTKLIGDARFNTYGLAYHYTAIYVDEFLHGESANNLKENYNAILTGMENAKWSREKGAIDYEQTVSFALFGNIKDESLKEYNVSTFSNNNREIVEGILRDKLKLDMIDALMQRLTYVEYLIVKDYQIMQDLNRDENGNVLYLDPSISRGIIKVLAERVLKQNRLKKNPKNRYERHMNRLYAILKALDVEINEDTIERLVYGDITFWSIRNELFKRLYKCVCGKTFNDPEELNQHKANCELYQNLQDKEAKERLNDNVEYNIEISNDDGENEIRYVTIEITRNLGERNEIIGVDGKTYKLEKNERVTLPYENAIILVKNNVAKAIYPPDFVLEAEASEV